MAELRHSTSDWRRHLEARLDVPDGLVVAVLGANGAGTTLLGLVAGTITATSGDVRIGGVGVTRLPPHRRRVALLSQDALLFPHLSVLDNVAFAPRAAGVQRTEADEQARTWLAAVDAVRFAHRRPG